MALTFGAATTDRVDCSRNANIDSLATWTTCWWEYPTTLTASRVRWRKGTDTIYRGTNIPGGANTDELLAEVVRATTTTQYRTDNANITVNNWWFWAVTFDVNAAAGEVINIYLGSLTAAPTERTYGLATDGVGAVSDDSAGNFWIGNRPLADRAFQGRIAGVAHFNRVLTAGEITMQWMLPRNVSGCVGFWVPGYNGTANVPDWSGQALTGTITGATVGDHVPLGPPFAGEEWVPYVVAAPAALPPGLGPVVQQQEPAHHAGAGAILRY